MFIRVHPWFLLAWCLGAVLLAGGVGAAAEPAIWNWDIARPLPADAKLSGDALAPLELVSPRGGTVSAMFVSAGGEAAANLVVRPEALKGKSGGEIPASAIGVRFASTRSDAVEGPRSLEKLAEAARADFRPQSSQWFDALLPKPDAQAEILPVVVTVSVPREAAAGVYEGAVSVGTASGQRRVPLRLLVCDYTPPKPADYRLRLNFLESYETVARRFDVPLFSDEHFRLLESSFALMGELGCHTIYAPVLEGGHLGNTRGLIHFRKQGGELTPDFTVFDRYYRLFVKHCGKPRVVILGIFEMHLNHPDKDGNDVQITLVEGPGKYATETIEYFPSDGAVWQKLLPAMAAHLKQLGHDPAKNQLFWGFRGDGSSTPEQKAFAAKVTPEVRWAAFTHGYGGTGSDCVWATFVDSHEPQRDRILRWQPHAKRLMSNSVRDFHVQGSPPFIFRCVPDRAAQGQFDGLSHIGLDYWSLPASRPGKNDRQSITFYRLLNPRGRDNVGRVLRSFTASLTVPGNEGALGTLRYEMLREGLQQVEARLLIESALMAKRVPEPLVAECETALRELILTHHAKAPGQRDVVHDPQWQKRSQLLFEAAAKLAKALEDR